MATKEGNLVSDDLLVLRAVVDIEVIDTRIGTQLTERGSACGCDRGPRLGNLVGLADTNEPRTLQPAGQTARTVGQPQ